LKIRALKGGDLVLSVMNTLSIKELKAKYLEKLNDNSLTVDQLRLFFAGKELMDDLHIYSYDIKDEMTLQSMIRKAG
jgi:hypothetical protein